LSLYIDGMLDSEEAGALEKHIGACGECREEYLQLKEMAGLLAGIPESPVPDGFDARLRAALDQAAAAGAHTGQAAGELEQGRQAADWAAAGAHTGQNADGAAGGHAGQNADGSGAAGQGTAKARAARSGAAANVWLRRAAAVAAVFAIGLTSILVYNNKEWRDTLFLGMDYGADNQVMTAGMGDAAARLDDAALENAAAELNDAAAGLNNAAAGLGGAAGEGAGPGGSAGTSDNGGGRQATGGPEAAARIAPAPKSVGPEPPQADGAQDAAETGAVQDARALALMDGLPEAADGLTASAEAASTEAPSIEAGPMEVAPNEAGDDTSKKMYGSMDDGTNGAYATGQAPGVAAAESAPALGADVQQAAEPAPALDAGSQQAADPATASDAGSQQGFGASDDPERKKCDELVKEKLKGWAYDVVSITKAGTGYRYRIYAYRDGNGAEIASEMELVCDGGRAEFAAMRLIDELEEV
jgi:hypothetical protein